MTELSAFWENVKGSSGKGERTMREKVCLLLLLVLLLTGCGAQKDAVKAEGPEQTRQQAMETAEPEVKSAAAEPDQNMTATMVEKKARPLTEEEILTAYDRSVTAYSWFDLSPLQVTGEATEVDGVAYYRVDARGIQDLEDLRIYLRSVFSDEVADQLLATGGDRPLYREIDGALYRRDGGREKDSAKGASSIEIEQISETEYSVDVTVDLLDEDQTAVTGLECWAFPYVYEEGRWVFSAFQLVY